VTEAPNSCSGYILTPIPQSEPTPSNPPRRLDMLSRGGQSHKYPWRPTNNPFLNPTLSSWLRVLFFPFLFVLTMYRGSSVHPTARQNLHWAHYAKPRRVASPSMVHDAVWRLTRTSGVLESMLLLPTWAHHSWHTQSITSAPQHSAYQ
jgi:hypothetical protein